MRIKWKTIEEKDEKMKWRAEINSEKFGKYAWIEFVHPIPGVKYYSVSVDYPEKIEVIRCTSLAGAKSWIREHLGGK